MRHAGRGDRARTATRRIAAQPDLAGVHVVILATFELDAYISDGLRAGAAGFLVKNTDQAGLVRPAGRRQLLWAASR